MVDAAGWCVLVALGPVVAREGLRRGTDPLLLFLLAIAIPYVAYAWVMDPLYGAYLDWDLWAPGTPVVSLLAGWCFLQWARSRKRYAGALLGLVLACATTHALARLHATTIDRARHLLESPEHVSASQRGAARRAPTNDSAP